MAAEATEKVTEHTVGAAEGEQGLRGQVLTVAPDRVARAVIRNTKIRLTTEMARADLGRAEVREVRRAPEGARNTAEAVARLVEMSARRVRSEALVSSEPEPVVERAALSREVKTAEPVALGNHTPVAVAEREAHRAQAPREQVAILDVVTAVAGVMVRAELAVPAEYLVAERAAAVAIAEPRAAWAVGEPSGFIVGKYYSSFTLVGRCFGIAPVTLLANRGGFPPATIC